MKPFFEDKDFRLYLGDSIKILSKLPKESVDMIFADPPYNLSSGGITCKGGKMESVDKGEWDKPLTLQENLKFTKKWIRACASVLKPNGTIWISGTYHSIYSTGYALLSEKFKIINDIAWFKPNAPPNLSCKCFTASHETIIWAKKDNKKNYTFNYKEMKFKNWDDDPIKKEGKQMRSVWVIPSAKKSEKKSGSHPAQKPLAVLKRIIEASTKEGDLILDPFCGSSTTGIQAILMKRKFIGIDIMPEYVELSEKRYKDIFKIWDV